MRLIRYNIELIEPLLVRSDSGDPNSAVSHCYIPGSIIRGALIECWRRQKEFLISDPDVRSLFFSDMTCFLNAYPVHPNYGRCLPAPLTLYVPKDGNQEQEVYDIAVTDQSESDGTVPFSPGFVSFANDEQIFIRNVERGINVHIARPKLHGTPTKDDGAVFQIESLKEGQVFQAIILAEQERDIENLIDLLPRMVQIGSSKGGGYGRIAIERADVRIDNASPEMESKRQEFEFNNIILTLSSHAIFRNSDGITARSASDVERFLSEEIGEPVEISRAFARVAVASGFNRKWRLPLSQEYCLIAGSVFVIDSLTDSGRARLEILALTGLGERRNEGFGRFCINMHGHSCYSKREDEFKKPTHKVNITETSLAYANTQLVVDRLARKQWQQQLQERIRKIDIGGAHQASKSQINGLRNLIEDLIHKKLSAQESAQRLRHHIESMQSRQVSRNQMERVKIERKPLVEWLESRCDEMESVATARGSAMSFNTSIELGGIKPSMSSSAKHEFELKLLHGVVMRLSQGKDRENLYV